MNAAVVSHFSIERTAAKGRIKIVDPRNRCESICKNNEVSSIPRNAPRALLNSPSAANDAPAVCRKRLSESSFCRFQFLASLVNDSEVHSIAVSPSSPDRLILSSTASLLRSAQPTAGPIAKALKGPPNLGHGTVASARPVPGGNARAKRSIVHQDPRCRT